MAGNNQAKLKFFQNDIFSSEFNLSYFLHLYKFSFWTLFWSPFESSLIGLLIKKGLRSKGLETSISKLPESPSKRWINLSCAIGRWEQKDGIFSTKGFHSSSWVRKIFKKLFLESSRFGKKFGRRLCLWHYRS